MEVYNRSVSLSDIGFVTLRNFPKTTRFILLSA